LKDFPKKIDFQISRKEEKKIAIVMDVHLKNALHCDANVGVLFN